jgi:hypothetical protein
MVTSAVVAVLGAEAVAAPGDRECQIVDRKLVCETDDPGGPPAPPTDEVNDGRGGARPTAYWTIVLVPEQMGNGDATSPCLDPNGQPGRTYRYTLRDSATGATLDTFTRCVATAEPASVIETPPSDPPTAAELLGAAPIPEPAILANPGGRGLTGLETRFWAADPGPVTVSVTIRGWNVTGTLNAQQWTWTTGDGGRYEAANPGSPEHPAARHIYDTKDTWPVALEASWSGSYTVSGFGTSYTVTGLATTGSSTLDYDVIEVRGVVDEPQPAASP